MTPALGVTPLCQMLLICQEIFFCSMAIIKNLINFNSWIHKLLDLNRVLLGEIDIFLRRKINMIL